MKHRIRIYSALFGNEDFTGRDYASLVVRAHAKVAAYLAAGTHARFVGEV